MKKFLEDYLWQNICHFGQEDEFHKFPRVVITEMINNGWINSPKQAWRTLEKWVGKGIYDYGSCLDMGWKKEGKF